MANNFTAQMQLGKQCQAQIGGLKVTLTPTRQEEMSAFQQAKAGSGRKLLIYARLATAEKFLPNFPNDMLMFDSDDNLSDVKKVFVDRFNDQWHTYAPGSLQCDEVNICWPPNIKLSGNCEHGSIGEAYDTHLAMPGFPLKNFVSLSEQSKRNPNPKQGKGQYMHLWLVIDIAKVEMRLGISLPQSLGGRARNKRRLEDDDVQPLPSKRSASGPLVSTYGKGSRATVSRPGPKFTSSCAVTLQIAKITDEGDGEVSIDFDEGEIVSGVISHTSIGEGLTKTVFPVSD
ncbi:hypothetical protein VKT23_016362 [Stygiomarasmius scandens]|uniref:Uncharacterized protein n=1 Tax=Marasmiellus scandens TaxID=2682957 RepID=A0ABR1IXW5_9AGAR